MKIPFPYWLWEEIALSYRSGYTLIRLIATIIIISVTIIGFLLGKEWKGIVGGFVLAFVFCISGFFVYACILKAMAQTLKSLVKWKIVAEPDFENQNTKDNSA